MPMWPLFLTPIAFPTERSGGLVSACSRRWGVSSTIRWVRTLPWSHSIATLSATTARRFPTCTASYITSMSDGNVSLLQTSPGRVPTWPAAAFLLASCPAHGQAMDAPCCDVFVLETARSNASTATQRVSSSWLSFGFLNNLDAALVTEDSVVPTAAASACACLRAAQPLFGRSFGGRAAVVCCGRRLSQVLGHRVVFAAMRNYTSAIVGAQRTLASRPNRRVYGFHTA